MELCSCIYDNSKLILLQICQEFENGTGKVLQAKLEDRANRTTNWVGNYSRPSMAQTLMARLPQLFQTGS